MSQRTSEMPTTASTSSYGTICATHERAARGEQAAARAHRASCGNGAGGPRAQLVASRLHDAASGADGVVLGGDVGERRRPLRAAQALVAMRHGQRREG